MKRTTQFRILLIMAVLLMAGNHGEATESNYWKNAANGTWSDPNMWSLGTVPTAGVEAWFTNTAASAYTVNITGSAVSEKLVVDPDRVIFDLHGNTWTNLNGLNFRNRTNVVTFTSSGAQGTVSVPAGVFSDDANRPLSISDPALWPTVTITNVILRCGTQVGYYIDIQKVNLNVQGPSAQLVVAMDGTYNEGVGGRIAVAGGARLDMSGRTPNIGNYWYDGGYWMQVVVSDGSSLIANTTVGNSVFIVGSGSCGKLIVSNSTVTSVGPGSMGIGAFNLWGNAGQPYFGDLQLNASTAVVSRLIMAFGNTDHSTGVRMIAENGSRVIVSNGYFIINATNTAYANLFLMDASTLELGSAGYPGALTNRAIMRVAGTMKGMDTTPGLVCNEGRMEIATNGIGALVLSNLNFEASASSLMHFDFNAITNGSIIATNDQIAISGGTAMIAGTVTFTNMPGFIPVRNMGKMWDFVRADSITYTATDNMNALMTSLGLTISDYTFGVASEGSFQALRLRVRPPSGTVICIK